LSLIVFFIAMWTPSTINKQLNSSFGVSPIINSRDWQMMKNRRLIGSARSSKNRLLINESPITLQIEAGCINQQPQITPGRLSTASACWTVLTIFVGLGLLSKPYAIAKGGWVSIPILGFLTFIANICGKLLVKCYETPQCRNSSSYADVVSQVMGYWPAIILVAIVVLEYIAGVCISLLFIWANLEAMMPGVSRLNIAVISSAMALPTIWILKLSNAWWLTLLGFISTLCIVSTLIYVRINYGEVDDVDLNNTVGPYVPLSTGIFILSLSGHAALPQVYREMSSPDDFNWVMDFSFIVMFLIYVVAGVTGYMIYGSSSHIIITTNMLVSPGGVIPKIVS